jgi:hypothetical protein
MMYLIDVFLLANRKYGAAQGMHIAAFDLGRPQHQKRWEYQPCDASTHDGRFKIIRTCCDAICNIDKI